MLTLNIYLFTLLILLTMDGTYTNIGEFMIEQKELNMETIMSALVLREFLYQI